MAILGSVSLSGLLAQTVSPGDAPAEFPPASFKGKQYVDSRGCVFIRAGIDGNVSWIPRATRKSTGICGFKPTFADQAAQVAPAQTNTVEVITLNDPAPTPAATSATTMRPVSAPSPRPMPVVVRQTAPTSATRPVKVVRAPAPQPRVVQASGVCPNASVLSEQYYQNTDNPVLCGPQGQAVVGAGTLHQNVKPTRPAIKANRPITVSPQRRIAPLHVAINAVNTTNFIVPKGYRKVWKDDRLNPHRAHQNLGGVRTMQLIWTSTVPRRLINQSTGLDVTAKVALVYPYIDYQRQQAELGEVTLQRRNGKLVKRVIRRPGTGQVVYSSRSARAVGGAVRREYVGR